MIDSESNDPSGSFEHAEDPLLAHERRVLCLGAEAFDRASYHAAHEHWEEAWRAARPSDPARAAWLQSLVLSAGAWHHEQCGRTVGRDALLARARERLDQSLAAIGEDTPWWRSAAERWRAAIDAAHVVVDRPPRALELLQSGPD